ncbi:S-adenosylmethionine:tRNA ribosyltransferase-isomerase [Tenuifilum osseticum]|uniref:S-adenosylmethionine:tRNA ribosyltransferase-isomerase n=1 Tax=Tenuifilum osseticum TaxID=3374723 RepID=UPI0034E3E64A
MKVKKISITDYDYELPDSRIAKHPLAERDCSKLLIYQNGEITNDTFRNIDQYITPKSLLILNNTKVVRARLRFKKESGATIEVFLIEPIEPSDYALSFSSKKKVVWKCIVGNLKRWKQGELQMEIEGTGGRLVAKQLKRLSEGVEVEFSWNNSSMSFADIVEKCGTMPIPPYLNRESEDIDGYRYQTIYAEPEGSVAAPTAGLHFTPKVFESLSNIHVKPHYITLHVGAGTFKPVTSDTIEDHEMHTEHFFVSLELVKRLYQNSEPVVCVGTTTLRTLESLYWLGVKLKLGKVNENFNISQWEPYELDFRIDVGEAFKALYEYMASNGIGTLSASTQIIIAPGYEIKTCDALITNFHQPRSTLLLLVAAAVGNDWKKIYQFALDNNFRFLSYGDSSLLHINKST